MDTVNLAHAKGLLEDLVARVAKGEIVYIRDAKLGTVKVVSVGLDEQARPKRIIGQWKDTFVVDVTGF